MDPKDPSYWQVKSPSDIEGYAHTKAVQSITPPAVNVGLAKQLPNNRGSQPLTDTDAYKQIVDHKDDSYWCVDVTHIAIPQSAPVKYDVTEEIAYVQKHKADVEVLEPIAISGLIEFSEAVLSALDRVSVYDTTLRERDSSARGAGFAYAAWNASFPELIKIGATRADHPHTRVRSLSGAGVPDDFELVTFIATADPFGLERDLHRHFAHLRRAGRHREFFFLSKEAVITHFMEVTYGLMSRQV